MIDYREILEHDLGRVGPAPFGFDEVARRRERRQRNRRIAAAAVALGLAILVIGGWLGAVALDRSVPADDVQPRPPAPLNTPDAWTRVRFPVADAEISAITDGGPGLVAVGFEGIDGATAIWTSNDGRAWEHVPQEFSTTFSDVSSGGPGLVAVGFTRDTGDGAPIWTSADGLAWTQAAWDPSFEGAWLRAVIEGGPGVVAVGSNREGTQVWYSTDGETWESAAVPAPPSRMASFGGQPEVLVDLATSDGRLIVVGTVAIRLQGSTFGYKPILWLSDDGITWVETDAPRSQAGYIEWIAAGPEGFVGGGTYSVRTSEDGETWTDAARNLHFDEPVGHMYFRMTSVTAGAGGYVAIGRDSECVRWGGEEAELYAPDTLAGACRIPEAAIWTSSDGTDFVRVGPDARFRSWSGGGAAGSTATPWGSRFVVVGHHAGGATLWISDQT